MDEKTTVEDSGMDVLKVSRKYVNKLRVIAAASRRPMWELFQEYAGPAIDREYRRVVAEMNKTFDAGGEG